MMPDQDATRNADSPKQPSILVRPPPFFGESWAGYLMRLSARNGFGGIRDIAGVLGSTAKHLLAEDPESTLRRLGIEWHNEATLTPAERAINSKRCLYQMGKGMRFKFCPACLAEDEVQFIRSEWEGLITFTCLHHGTRLCDVCSTCGATPSALQAVHTRCVCGSPYASESCEAAPAHLMALKSLLFEAFPTEPKGTFASYSQAEIRGLNCLKWVLSVLEESPGSEGDIYRKWNRYPLLSSQIRNLSLLEDFTHGMELVASKVKDQFLNGHRISYASRLRADSFLAMYLLNQRLLAGERHSGSLFAISIGGVPAMSVSPWQTNATSNNPDACHADVTATSSKVGAAEDRYKMPLSVIDSSNVETWRQILRCSEATISHFVRRECLLLESGTEDLPRRRIGSKTISALMAQLQNLSEQNAGISVLNRTYFDEIASQSSGVDAQLAWDKAFNAIRNGRLKLLSTTKTPMSFEQLYVRADALHEILQAT